MTATLTRALEYVALGLPVPCDLAFDLLAVGIDPDTLKTDERDAL